MNLLLRRRALRPCSGSHEAFVRPVEALPRSATTNGVGSRFGRPIFFIGALLIVARASANEAPPSSAAAHATGPIVWHAWSPEIFAQAKREKKFILLDLEAVWCHWCHVMAETTYRDPKVVALINARYLAVRVDQDARPDLANRYEDYGWPATVIYGPDGGELIKRQGYVPPVDMSAVLQAVIDDPTPGPSVASERAAPAAAAPTATATAFGERRIVVLQQWLDGYDDKAGGWGFSHKFLDWDNVELALRLAARGDAHAAEMARTTLRLQGKLLDPVWGGVYQYSVGGDWDEPHFEKIMQMQAENIRIYAQAYAQWHDPVYLASARAIHGYVRKFLTSADGVVYTSQDADLVPGEHSADYFSLDDTARRARGVPRIDRHIYARENGWVISALCQLAVANEMNGSPPVPVGSGNREVFAKASRLSLPENAPDCRAEAVRAAEWVIAHRALPGGGFRHDESDTAGPYLGDTLAMGRAFLALHQLTAEARWLQRANEAAEFIRAHFARGEQPGFASSDTTRESFPLPLPQFDENVGLVRFANALAHVTGRAEFRETSASALRWLLAPGVAEERRFYVGGWLLAEEETRIEPAHMMIVGRKDDATARSLHALALRWPETYKLVEWWDRSEGPAPRGEDIYPELPGAAAFLCANGACSLPLKTEAAFSARLAKFAGVRN